MKTLFALSSVTSIALGRSPSQSPLTTSFIMVVAVAVVVVNLNGLKKELRVSIYPSKICLLFWFNVLFETNPAQNTVDMIGGRNYT